MTDTPFALFLRQAQGFCKALGMSLDVFWHECERDWGTEGYERWVRIADKRYGRGAYGGHDGGRETPIGDGSDPRAGEEMVAGEGVEPPTQGFSVPCSTN